MRRRDVRIRPYAPSDAEALYEAVRESIDEVGAWLEWCHPDYTIDESRGWIDHCMVARSEGREYNFAIVDADGAFLGGCGLNRIEHNHRVANLGYWVRTGAAGQGVATAATMLLARFAFHDTNLNRLQILASTRNIASQRVAERAGARREAVAPARLFLRGEPHDAVQYALLRTEFRADAGSAE